MTELQKVTQDIANMVDVQTQDGNWNYCPYALGYANGLILALATLKGEEAVFLSRPEKWLSNRPIDMFDSERNRQVSQEGWSREHDDLHDKGELARMAACYSVFAALSDKHREIDTKHAPYSSLYAVIRRMWPTNWDWRWWKPKSRIRDLVRAGALLVAEIERLQRIEWKKLDAKEDESVAHG